ncbi:MAG: PilZ domain-containing protein [Nitrospiraceae bacterium]|nr:MAG: PilZ domain-containing protein [Nitrospiraceae bacterium]
MSKRAFERVSASFAVKFPHDGGISYGIVTDMSENGMCIRSGKCASCDTELKVLFPMASSNLEVPVRIVRSLRTLDFYDIMGVKLLRPSKKYMKIVRKAK